MKVIKMLLVVVILFALSWLPLYAIFTRVKFGPQPITYWEDQLIRTLTPVVIKRTIYIYINNRSYFTYYNIL